jgi:hypothetical protein
MIVEHLRQGQLDFELAQAEELRDPPVPVAVWLLLDGREHDGLLYGWAPNPRGANDGWRGLVRGVREFAPGFEAEFLTWVRAEDIRQRPLCG